MKPGIYTGLSMAEYLRIPALSSGVAYELIDRCPYAAWHCSPLNPKRVIDTSDATDVGTVAHSIFLEDNDDLIEEINPIDYLSEKGTIPDGWTNKPIKHARDAARAAGKIPMLTCDVEQVRAMVSAAHAYVETLRESEPALWELFQPDQADTEIAVVWHEGDTLCKLRADKLSRNRDVALDYKTSGRNAEPSQWGRTQLHGLGYYFGAAWYRRGIYAAFRKMADYVFLCQEKVEPYLCSLVGVDPATKALGDEQVEHALGVWKECMRNSSWPKYPNRVCYPELPAYKFSQWQERTGEREPSANESEIDSVMAAWR